MDQDPKHLDKPTEGDREIYFQALLLAEKLGERLAQTTQPDASELFFIVNNPLIIDRIQLPTELIASGLTIEQVRLEITESFHDGYPATDTTLVLELDNDSECRIPIPSGDSEDITYFYIPPKSAKGGDPTPQPLEGQITRTEVSALISRLVEPSTDPAFTNFRRLDSVAARQEVTETLENTDYVQIIEVDFYELDGHGIVVSKDTVADAGFDKEAPISLMRPTASGRVTEISVTLPKLGESETIALRTTLDHSAHSQEIYMYDGSARRTIPPYPEEILAFRDTLEVLLEKIGEPSQTVESYEALAQSSITREYTTRKAPEEREHED